MGVHVYELKSTKVQMMIIPKNINEPLINLFSFGGNQDSQSHLRNFFLTFKIGLSQAAVAKTYVFWQGQHY